MLDNLYFSMYAHLFFYLFNADDFNACVMVKKHPVWANPHSESIQVVGEAFDVWAIRKILKLVNFVINI